MTAHVHLFGKPRVQLEDGQIDFLADKRFQFLALLAYFGTWVDREKLSFIFWPDTPTEQGRHSLRQLLRRVHALDWVSGLDAERHRIRWQVTTDLGAFQAALAAGDAEAALRYYRGPLLDGLESDDASEFDVWLTLEREQLQARWRSTLLAQATERERTGHHEQAAALLSTLLERDPLDEEVLQGYMRAATQAGRELAALRRYRIFAERLARELDLEPTTATQHLAKAIGEREPPPEASVGGDALIPPATAGSVSGSLPRQASSFVGRAQELGALERMLDRPECRLVTLLGPGGVGKSRLALQVAHALSGAFAGRVSFVPLESELSSKTISTSIAETMDVNLHGRDPPAIQVARHIGQQRILLVLDDFESILHEALAVSELLRACPHLRIIVTSRERLKLVEEWLFPVEGMLPSFEERTSLSDALRSDAVQLFFARARQFQPDFALDDETLPHVLRICRLVEGLPLGIELAAAWVRSIPIAELADEIESNLDILSSRSRNSVERHRSLSATFEYSWSQLTPKEQEALRGLAVFAGGFTRTAATVVASVSSTVLAALIDKSMLRVSPGGRYGCHSLVLHFTRAKLAELPAEENARKDRHVSYFTHFLENQWQKLLGRQAGEGLRAIVEDFENILLAWRRLLEDRHVERVMMTIPILTFFFDARIRYREGISLFEQATVLLDGTSSHHTRVRGNLRAGQAWLHLWLGDPGEALRLGAEALRMLETERGDWGYWLVQRTHGFIALFRGDFDEAARCWREEIVSLQQGGRFPIEADLLSRLALAHASIGDVDAAARYLERALAASTRSHYPRLTCLLYAGFTELTLAHPRSALILFREADTLARTLGDERYLPHLAYGSGSAALELGRFAEAKMYCQQGLALAGASGDRLATCWSTTLLGRALLELEDRETARTHLYRGLEDASHLGFAPVLRYGVTALAELEARSGNPDTAREWLRAVIAHPERDYLAESYARRVLHDCVPSNDPDENGSGAPALHDQRFEELIGTILSP